MKLSPPSLTWATSSSALRGLAGDTAGPTEHAAERQTLLSLEDLELSRSSSPTLGWLHVMRVAIRQG